MAGQGLNLHHVAGAIGGIVNPDHQQREFMMNLVAFGDGYMSNAMAGRNENDYIIWPRLTTVRKLFDWAGTVSHRQRIDQSLNEIAVLTALLNRQLIVVAMPHTGGAPNNPHPDPRMHITVRTEDGKAYHMVVNDGALTTVDLSAIGD
jgi:hypothetical protein